ncbi:MAG TPA: hypothetical protein VIU15_47235 [Streptomyces sp.]
MILSQALNPLTERGEILAGALPGLDAPCAPGAGDVTCESRGDPVTVLGQALPLVAVDDSTFGVGLAVAARRVTLREISEKGQVSSVPEKPPGLKSWGLSCIWLPMRGRRPRRNSTKDWPKSAARPSLLVRRVNTGRFLSPVIGITARAHAELVVSVRNMAVAKSFQVALVATWCVWRAQH